MKKIHHSSSFKQNSLATMVLAVVAQCPANVAHANGGGYGPNVDISGATIDVQTYYAGSPQGKRPAYDFATHGLSTTEVIDTGTPLRKFVDPLGGVYNALEPRTIYNADGTTVNQKATDLQSGIPVAITEKWFNPITSKQTDDDYYEIAIIEYIEQMHSDLAKPTLLRGYVQVETPAIAKGLKDAAGLISEHIPATYPDGTPITDANGNQVHFVHRPHYLGPVIVASKGTPVRLKYTNYLPYTDANGQNVGHRNGGEMPIPVDKYLMGGGPVIDKDGKPVELSQNRADIHWHGGDTPWISDGTPHQWTAPAGEAKAWEAGIGTGASFQNVPDMPDPGPGSGTLYFPNNLSGRLMFYHDHTSGLTRLNVYMGEAAGYVVVDPDEQALVKKTLEKANGVGKVNGLDTIGIPLVIQDKGFVPNNIGTVPQTQDAKWDVNHWGQPGDLWFPHVYETNQDPNSWDGTNPVGRWDWGPWFWPVFPSQYSLPTGAYGDVTTTPEAFLDTSVVNGKAYPTLTVDPKTYRFRILNAGNDRSLNLSLFQAVDADGTVCSPAALAAVSKTAPVVATEMPGEAKLAPCTEVRMVPAVPTAGYPASWPTDGRAGGVPDPATAGPDFVQIGSEGGVLPSVAVIKSQPVTYDLDKRSITILNVLNHGLFLGDAERADVLIDFSKYRGQTLIVYNDAPTPMPAVDPRTDYYTGMGDMTDAGGAYDVLPGYGPNTRTVMQIKVNDVAPANALDIAALKAELPVTYAKTQAPPIIPQTAYNAPFGTTNVDNYAQIRTGGNSQPYFEMAGTTFAVKGLTLTSGGSGYKTAPTVTLSAPPAGGTQATATATITNGVVTGLTLDNPGIGYTNTTPLTVSFSAPGAGGTRAAARVETSAYRVINKAIQELFDPVYGRMNATLAVELPFSSALVATTIPLSYSDAPIEYLDGIKDGETQIWKITHNGVDSHPVHFHLVNVQLINRVDWAGVVKPPAANELGWKETIVMNPLEDIYVAAKAVRPVTPFGLPKSNRVLDPTQPVGATAGLTNIDPLTGQAPTFQSQLVNGVSVDVRTNAYSNQLTDFDNEYVWHCHILGHEENDFMRPMIFHPDVVRPDAPTGVAVNGTELTWNDPTRVGEVDAQGVPTAGTQAGLAGATYKTEPTNNPKNEIGFKVYESADAGATFVLKAKVPANATSWTGVDAANQYQVVAYNAAGESSGALGNAMVTAPAAIVAGNAPVIKAAPAAAAPTGLIQTYSAAAGTSLSWDAVAGASGYIVTAGGKSQTVTTTAATLSGAPLGSAVTVSAIIDGVTGTAASVFNGKAYSPLALTATNGKAPGVARGSVTLTWANSYQNVGNVTGLTLTWFAQGSATAMGSKQLAATSTGATVIGLTPDKVFDFRLVANSTLGDSAAVSIRALSGN